MKSKMKYQKANGCMILNFYKLMQIMTSHKNVLYIRKISLEILRYKIGFIWYIQWVAGSMRLDWLFLIKSNHEIIKH